MNEMSTRFGTAWSGCLQAPVSLDDTPAYPIARTVQMPSGHPYESGALSFALSDLTLGGLDTLDLGRCSVERDGTRAVLRLALPEVTLRGRHAVRVKPDPIVAIDTAGDLMDLSPEARRPVAAGTDPTSVPTDPQKEEWKANARDQRPKLMQTENGKKLLDTFDAHNDTYEEVFRESGTLQNNWQAGGATKAMAADTHVAVKHDGVVNDANKLYATDTQGQLTYNGNSFAQRLNVAVACMLVDFDPLGTEPPSPDSKYWKASKAALAFGEGVKTATNNTPENVNEMKASHVHETVAVFSGPAPGVSDADALQALTNAPPPGGAESGSGAGWIVVSENERARLDRMRAAILKERAENASITGRALFEGGCEARMEDVRIVVELAIVEGGQGSQARALHATVELPAFDLDIDDSAWAGDAGVVAQQRLAQIDFIRTLLHASICGRLQTVGIEAGAYAYNAAAA